MYVCKPPPLIILGRGAQFKDNSFPGRGVPYYLDPTCPHQLYSIFDMAYEETLTKLNVRAGFVSLGYLPAADGSFDPRVRDLDYEFEPSHIPPPVVPKPAAKPARSLRQPRLQEFFGH